MGRDGRKRMGEWEGRDGREERKGDERRPRRRHEEAPVVPNVHRVDIDIQIRHEHVKHAVVNTECRKNCKITFTNNVLSDTLPIPGTPKPHAHTYTHSHTYTYRNIHTYTETLSPKPNPQKPKAENSTGSEADSRAVAEAFFGFESSFSRRRPSPVLNEHATAVFTALCEDGKCVGLNAEDCGFCPCPTAGQEMQCFFPGPSSTHDGKKFEDSEEHWMKCAFFKAYLSASDSNEEMVVKVAEDTVGEGEDGNKDEDGSESEPSSSPAPQSSVSSGRRKIIDPDPMSEDDKLLTDFFTCFTNEHIGSLARKQLPFRQRVVRFLLRYFFFLSPSDFS